MNFQDLLWEIIIEIACYDVYVFIKLKQINHYFYNLSNDKKVWNKMVRQNIKIMNIEGINIYKLAGKYHREEILNDDGTIYLENGPTIKSINGSELWYKLGKLDRLDGPAKIDEQGTKYWYKDGLLHRGNDLPAIEYINNIKKEYYYYNGIMYRITTDDIDKWYKDGKLHRENGRTYKHCKIFVK